MQSQIYQSTVTLKLKTTTAPFQSQSNQPGTWMKFILVNQEDLDMQDRSIWESKKLNFKLKSTITS